MSKYMKIVLALFFVFALVAHAQKGHDDEGTGAAGAAGDQNDGEYHPMPGGNEEEQIRQRNKLMSCIVLSRHYFSSINQDLSNTLRASPSGQQLYKKMLGDFMLHCFFTVRHDEAQEFFSDLQNKTFVLANWEHLHNFDLGRYQGDVDIDLSPEQERLVELVDEFDKQMKEKYGDDQSGSSAEEEYYASNKKLDYEPKLGGFSMKNIPSSFRMLFVTGFIVLIGVGFFLAMKKLFTPEVSAYEKKRQEVKDKKRNKSGGKTKQQ
jgi:ABC-type uncharacterized transport system substrate-binding protein